MSGPGKQGRQRAAQHEILVGRSLQNGEYQVEKVLGHGGMGQVFLASHRTLDVPVALKQVQADQPLPESVIAELDSFLHSVQSENATPGSPTSGPLEIDFPLSGGTNTDRFLREALLLLRLHHPAIPTLYDYFFEDGYWYLVMDYVPGQTLAAYMRRNAPLPPLEAINYTMQLCDVLGYLHKQSPPVIFRDLKPSNVILTPDGRLMLVDFGIARYFKEGQINDTTDFGSPGYASPEQYEGLGQTDARSDLFTLGVILYEMISGQRPARAGSRGSKSEVLHHINPAPSPALSGLVTVATRTEPIYRFQSAQAFYHALERTRAIEEQRAYRRQALLAEEIERPKGAGFQGSSKPPDTHSHTGTRLNVPHSPIQKTQRLYIRESLHRVDREQLEQEALAIQLASIDESLKQRAIPSVSREFASSAATVSIEREEEDRDRYPGDAPGQHHANKPVAGRIIQVCFILALLLSLVMTSLFAYNRFVQHTSTSSFKQISHPTSQPSIPGESTWQVLPSSPSPEADNTATYVQVNGRAYIYVTGGYRGSENTPHYSRSLYRYDIAAAHWETVISQGFPGMGNNAAALDEHNSFFFTVGYSSDAYAVTSLLYMYRPADGSLKKIVPPAQIPIGFGGEMIADQQGHLYISQGFMTPGNPHVLAGTGWYRYDIDSGQWHLLAPSPTGLGYVALAPDGLGGILMLGGSRDAGQHLQTAQVYRYDILQNAWTLEQESGTTPSALSGAASCSDGQGHIVVIGGYDAVHNASSNQTWLVNLRTLQWKTLAALPSGGSLLGAAACDRVGHVFLERGANNPNRPTADFLELTIKQ